MPLLGNIISGVLDPIVGSVTGGSVGTTVSAGTSGSSGTSGTSSTPSTPITQPVNIGLPISMWNVQVGETLFLNMSPNQGPTAWVPFVVRYVFADGNAVLTKDPDVVAYTAGYVVGQNLRRKSEIYNSTYPGP